MPGVGIDDGDGGFLGKLTRDQQRACRLSGTAFRIREGYDWHGDSFV